MIKLMYKTTLTDFFKEVETTEEYNGYFCSIAEAIVSGKGDYLLNAKSNQRNLETEISEYVHDTALCKTMDSARQTEKNHDRIEYRTAYVTDDISWLHGKEKRKNMTCIGAIKTEFERNGSKSEQWHYYISSRKLSTMEI